jgi:hypothetical protein
VQVPLALFIATMAEPVPEPVHEPDVVIATGRLELDVAATGKLSPYFADAGAGVVTLIICVPIDWIFAEQFAVEPPFCPSQLQLHGCPLPLTADGVPVAQRFVDGAEVNVPPSELPQEPFTASAAKLAVMVMAEVTLLTVSGLAVLVTDPVQFTK